MFPKDGMCRPRGGVLRLLCALVAPVALVALAGSAGAEVPANEPALVHAVLDHDSPGGAFFDPAANPDVQPIFQETPPISVGTAMWGNPTTRDELADVHETLRTRYPERFAMSGYAHMPEWNAGTLPSFIPHIQRMYVLTFAAGTDVQALAAQLQALSGVISASVPPNPEFDAAPNDPEYLAHQQSRLAYIDMEAGWDKVTNVTDILVGFSEGGVSAHPDLVANIAENGPEKSGTAGVDDDGNGYIDDIIGWDYYGTPTSYSATAGHGTSVAGVLGAVGNNGVGVTGMAWSTGLVKLPSYIHAALDYADARGVALVNASYSASSHSPIQEARVKVAASLGVQVVGSAGNDYILDPYAYPAAFPDAIGVSSVDVTTTGSPYFHYSFGPHIDVAAPSAVKTLNAGTGYRTLYGTSTSAPVVTGILSLAHQYANDIGYSLTHHEMRQLLRRSAEHEVYEYGWDVQTGYGRINADVLLDAIDGGWSRCAAKVSTPLQGALADPSAFQVVGIAGGSDFGSYRVTLGVGTPHERIDGITRTTRWHWRSPHISTPVTEGVLAIPPLASTLRGPFTVHLEVFDTGGALCGEERIYINMSPDTPIFDLDNTALSRIPPANKVFANQLDVADIDGDGLDDLLVGSNHCDYPTCEVGQQSADGVVEVFLGSDMTGSSLARNAAHVRFASTTTGLGLGFSAAFADATADGVKDIVLGLPYYDDTADDEGIVCVFDGTRLGAMSTVDQEPIDDADFCLTTDDGSGEHLGNSVASLGDIDGDGLEDWAVTQRGYLWGTSSLNPQGAAWVYLGKDASAWLSGGDAESLASGRVEGSYGIGHGDRGFNIRGLGDLDGDGLDDFGVAAVSDGYVSVFYSVPSPSVTTGLPDIGIYSSTQPRVGFNFDSVDDITGDGVRDLVVGYCDTSFYYGHGGSAKIPTFGSSLNRPDYDEDCGLSGLAFIPSGLSTSAFYDLDFYTRIEPRSPWARMRAYASVGDLTGDGLSEIAIAAHGSRFTRSRDDGDVWVVDPTQVSSGQLNLLERRGAFVLDPHRPTENPSGTPNGQSVSTRYGYAIGTIDIDNDGDRELASRSDYGISVFDLPQSYTPPSFTEEEETVWELVVEPDPDAN